jgi:hypothetical protein
MCSAKVANMLLQQLGLGYPVQIWSGETVWKRQDFDTLETKDGLSRTSDIFAMVSKLVAFRDE